MKRRILGKTGFKISEISIGTWQVGGKWGSAFNRDNADLILNTAADNGINFFDTADVYENGESEKAVGRLVRKRRERIFVATKCGKRLSPHTDENYRPEALRKFVEDSLTNMGLETIDLIQLHCPPAKSYRRPEIFGLFDTLKNEGKIQHLGVSVETIDEALQAISYDNVTTIQIIFNMLRQRPSEVLFAKAAKRDVGIIARVPLASGLLTGRFSVSTKFGNGDHRKYNRNGEAFDKGETFSGIDYLKGLAIVDEIRRCFPADSDLAAMALRWILMFKDVSCVIPGASRPEQVLSNISASRLPELSEDQMKKIRQIYEEQVWPEIEGERW
jgi:aryl-alcohol dehydrogenase-like predicted oxidoreductase